MILTPDTTTARKVAVTASQAGFASSMDDEQLWMFVSTTNCWIKQANPSGTITCVAKASLVDTDFMTINDGINSAVLYEFDTAGDGVTGGRVQVNVSTDTTAAQVAERLKTAILANQSYISVTHNGSGVLTLTATSRNITLTENVTDAGFLVSFGPQASAAAGSMFIPANVIMPIDGRAGSNLSVIRSTADGDASLTKAIRY